MLLPSALPCDFLAPSLSAIPRARSSARALIAASPYHSPPIEDSGIVSATATGLLHTCRRLQHILSGGRMSPAPMLSVASGVRKNTRRIAASSSADEPPRTPLRRASTGYASSSRLSSLPKTPVPRGANKRTRSAAFPNASSQPPLGEESDNSDKDFNNSNRFATPQRNKRQRLTTPPPAPGRAPKTLVVVESDDDNDMDMDWTDDDDRHLVEMVVRKLQLTQSDWEECAMRLGKGDSRSLGKRWEGLLGSIALKNHRRKRIGGPRISRN